MQDLTASVALFTTQAISARKDSLERALIIAVIRRVKSTLTNMNSIKMIARLKLDQAQPE